MTARQWGMFGCAASMVFAAPVLAGPATDSSSGYTMKWYGHLNGAVITVDDGVQSDSSLADAGNSTSRAGVRISHLLSNGQEFRFRFETALGITSSTDFNQGGLATKPGWRRSDIRHVDFSLGGNWGKVSVGQGSMAADGAAEEGLSAVDLVLYSGNTDFNDRFRFRNAAGTLTAVEVGDAFSNFDGPRRGRIRYDTPTFNGFSASVAYGRNVLSAQHDDFADVALRYANAFGGTEVTATIAYQNRDRPGGPTTDAVVGSAAVAFSNGVSFAIGAGRQTTDGAANTPTYYYLQAAYDAQLLPYGTTAFGVDYFSGDDFNSVGSNSQILGIGLVQTFDDANLNAYLAYQVHSFDEVGVSYQDISTLVLGARWSF